MPSMIVGAIILDGPNRYPVKRAGLPAVFLDGCIPSSWITRFTFVLATGKIRYCTYYSLSLLAE